MTEKEAREKLMDYLYDEMDESEKARFEVYLADNPQLQNELKELQGTRSVFEKAEFEVPEAGPLSMHDFTGKRSVREKVQVLSTLRHWAVAASVLIAGVLLLAYADLRAGFDDNGFYLTMGQAPVPAQTTAEQSAVTEEQILMLLEQIREENALLMTAFAEQSLQRQNEQLEEAMNLLAAYYQEQRRQDLLMIAEGLTRLEEDTYYRFLQTDETIGELIYALSNP